MTIASKCTEHGLISCPVCNQMTDNIEKEQPIMSEEPLLARFTKILKAHKVKKPATITIELLLEIIGADSPKFSAIKNELCNLARTPSETPESNVDDGLSQLLFKHEINSASYPSEKAKELIALIQKPVDDGRITMLKIFNACIEGRVSPGRS
jgi:hypothetical protein